MAQNQNKQNNGMGIFLLFTLLCHIKREARNFKAVLLKRAFACMGYIWKFPHEMWFNDLGGQTPQEFFEAVQREHKKTKVANRLMQPLQMANIHHMNPRRFYFLALPSNWRSSMEGLSKEGLLPTAYHVWSIMTQEGCLTVLLLWFQGNAAQNYCFQRILS